MDTINYISTWTAVQVIKKRSEYEYDKFMDDITKDLIGLFDHRILEFKFKLNFKRAIFRRVYKH